MTANAFASLGPATFTLLVAARQAVLLRVTPMTRRRGDACVLGSLASVPVPPRRSPKRLGGGIRMRLRRGTTWSAHGRTTARSGTGGDLQRGPRQGCHAYTVKRTP